MLEYFVAWVGWDSRKKGVLFVFDEGTLRLNVILVTQCLQIPDEPLGNEAFSCGPPLSPSAFVLFPLTASKGSTFISKFNASRIIHLHSHQRAKGYILAR